MKSHGADNGDVARGKVGHAPESASRFPAGLTQSVQLACGATVTLRPIRPDDAAAELDFLRRLTPRSRYLRAFGAINDFSPDLVAHLTQIDLDREMALVAVTEWPPGERLIGVARYAIEPGTGSCEFAIVVDDQWQGTGLARKLMEVLIDAARYFHHLDTMYGETLAENVRMVGLARDLGFDARPHPADSHLILMRRAL